MSDFDYAYLEKFLRYKLFHYRDDLEFEDAIQEGLIRAWKDHESGKYEPNHLRNRAWSWAHNFLYKDGTYATGTELKRSREGITKKHGDAIREKVQQYQKEYYAIHAKKPSYQTVAEGTGFSKSQVAVAIRSLKTMNHIKPAYYVDSTGKTRLDHSAYRPSPLYQVDLNGEECIDPRAEKLTVENWEEEYIGTQAFGKMIEFLKWDSKAIVILYFMYGYSQREIAIHLGYSDTKSGQAIVSRLFRKALEDIKEHEEAKQVGKWVQPQKWSHCKAGHPMTPDNTKKRENGKSRCRKCAQRLQRESDARRKATKK
jgi:RNA polymerase sigma factor (sigma-70 family)